MAAPTSRTRTELARTTAEDVHRAAGLLPEFERRSVARRLGLPPTALTTDPNAQRLVRARVVDRSDEHLVDVLDHLTAAALEVIVRALGDAAENPDVEQLTAAIDATWDTLGPGVTALVLAVAIDREVPAMAACATVLTSHPGLVARPEPETDTAADDAVVAEAESVDDAKREARRARKEAERAARAARATTGPARYKRKR
ncbi:MAG: hypothetical protein RL531_410 [Actinomycetota bacterium]|jgi:hypothetical protein